MALTFNIAIGNLTPLPPFPEPEDGRREGGKRRKCLDILYGVYSS